jgi:tetratricopeptide (TPR) repeat protein
MQYLVDDHEAAAQTLEPLYPQFSSRIEFLFILGSCHGKVGREEKAAEIFARMLEVGGDSPRIHWLMGNAYLTAQVNQKAIEELEKARSDPRLPFVHYSLALAYYRAKRLEEARQALDNEIQLNPGFASAHGLLGSVFLDLRELDAAIASYHKSLELKPDQAAAFYGLGRAHMLKGDIPKAVEFLEKAEILKPDDDSVQFQLGQAYLKAGRKEEGQRALARARQLQVEERDMLERKVLGELPPSPIGTDPEQGVR